MLDLNNADIRSRLWGAIEAAEEKLAHFRKNRRELIGAYVGKRYREFGVDEDEKCYDTIVNLLYQWADIFALALVPSRPQFLVTPDAEDLGAFGARFELASNNLVKEIDLENVLRDIVLDAFFGTGIAKVGLFGSGALEIDDRLIDPGQPGCLSVSLDDCFWDVTAKKWRQVRFIGDRYALQLASCFADESFDREVLKKLSPRQLKTHDEKWGNERTESLSRGHLDEHAELTPMVELCDVYFPQDQMVATLAWRQPDLPPLKVVPLDGPELGPYRMLGFTHVPDNLMPIPPGDNLILLHEMYNGLMRKVRNQAQRQKTNTVYEDRAAKDVERLVKARDGEAVRVTSVEAIRSLAMGGAEQTNVLLANAVIQLFDRMGGNLSAMAGLGPQADTLGQEQLLYGQLRSKEEKMQYLVFCFTEQVGLDLGRLLWQDSYKRYEQYLYTQAGRIPVPAHWTPEEREGDFAQYNIKLDPYSMQFQSPAQRVQQINNLLMSVYMPLLPLIQEQGGALDPQALVEMHAKLLAEPRIKQLIRFAAPPMNGIDQKSPRDPLPKSPTSTRTYVRKQAHGPRRDSPMDALMSQMGSSSNGAPKQAQPA